jgi:hypothetical protein
MPVHRFDSWMKRLSRPGLLMLAVLVLGVGLVACGGGDDEEDSGGSDATSTAAASGGSSSGGSTATAAATTATGGSSSGGGATVGTEKGNQIANDAMLVVADLPGSGWAMTATDQFDGSLLDAEDSELTDTPACAPYVKKITNAAKAAEAARVGRAARGFQQPNSLFGMSLDVEVAVFKDSKTPSTLISEAKGAFGSADFENCFREILKGSEGDIPEDVKFELKSSKPLASVPNNGVAQAFDVTLSSAGVSFQLHAELYAWANKNATAFVTIFGSPEEVKADVVKAAVSKTEEKLSKAQ